MQDGFYAHNDDTDEKKGPFDSLDHAREEVADWIDDGDEVIVHEVEDGIILYSWECTDGDVMGNPDFEGQDFEMDAA